MKLLILNVLLTLLTINLFAQSGIDFYRSTENKNYWKNKMPYAGYWQQDVNYLLKANIDERTNIIEGSEQLTYFNNSPDTLKFVYFHLYQNAFQPSSYLDNLQKQNNVKPRYGKYEAEKRGTEISKIQNNGNDLKTELDNTILKVYLPKPLPPSSSIDFTIDFKTYFDLGNTRRRMKLFNSFGSKHFDGVHWYPRICVYDAKFGWDTQQHLGKEFYGDFGVYDLELTFSSNFVVEATGVLQNPNEVLPKELRDKLDIKNFANKKWNEAPSIITPYDPAQRKTWKFHAENVHDAAFTADPNYRIGEAEWNGIKVYAICQEPHASKWQNAAAFTAKVIETYSRDFGMYVYPKMVVADAQDGMEYPMLTLDGGFDPDYRQLLAHEVGHNWFFGMVGNNETYRAMLDEGFTQFLTAWAMEHIDGKYIVKNPPKSKYLKKFTEADEARYVRAYYGYLNDAVRDQDEFLNTHSDGFHGALAHGGGYRHVYYKTATMLYNLQYVLGDSLFLAAMQNYFATWKIAHPYVEDLRESFIRFTKVDLNWFFDQWIETDKRIDYAVTKLHKTKNENEYEVHFERKGRMQMPIDFSVTDLEDSVLNYHIPNTWFVKNTNATVLPKWMGWDKLQPKYVAKINVPAGIKKVEIDPSQRLADKYMLDNSIDKLGNRGTSILRFDSRIYHNSDWRRYEMYWRPDVWYNGVDGVKAGLHLNGNYMLTHHLFEATVWYNTLAGQQKGTLLDKKYSKLPFPVSWNVYYNTATNSIIKRSSVTVRTRMLDGLSLNSIKFNIKDNTDKNEFYFEFKSMFRDSIGLNYLLNQNDWIANRFNNQNIIAWEHRYHYVRGHGEITSQLRTSSIGSDYAFGYLSTEVRNYNNLGRINLNTRFYAQLGGGSSTPLESMLYLLGSNSESMMENKYIRSQGIVPESFGGYGINVNHFQNGGGLNLRGFAGYYAPEVTDSGYVVRTFRGNSGASVSGELELDELIKLMPRKLRDQFKFDFYLFGDAGTMVYDNYSTATNTKHYKMSLRADAGIGTTLTIKKWGVLQKVNPLVIRFDMPLVINSAPYIDPKFVKFRWVLGIGRSF